MLSHPDSIRTPNKGEIMDINSALGMLFLAAAQLAEVEPNTKPEFRVVSQQELQADLCVKPEECNGIKSFSPPQTNIIYISKDLNPLNPLDQGVIVHQFARWLYYDAGYSSPLNSCESETKVAARARIVQLKYLAHKHQAVVNSGGESFDIYSQPGKYMTFCVPDRRDML